jgi:hypothetical protein
MKKLIGAVIIIALLSAGICFGVLFTAKSRSKILLAEYLRGIDNWSVESAYFNPFTHSLKIKGFTVAPINGAEFTVKNMLLSDFKQVEDTISFSASLEEILFIIDFASLYSQDPPEDAEDSFSNPKNMKITADSLSASVLLDKERLVKFIETPELEFNPLKSFDALELNNAAFSIDEQKFISLESMTGDGYHINAMFHLAAGEDNKSINLNFSGASFYPADSVSTFSNLVIHADEEYLIERIIAATTYRDGVYTKKINIDSRDLFLLDLSCNIVPIEAEEELDSLNMSDAAGFQGLINSLKTLMLYDFELHYTDRSFANIIVLDRYLASQNLRREAVIDSIEAFAKNSSDWGVLLNGLAAFLREPETVMIKAKPVKPASIYHFIYNIYELGLSLSFNGSDEILVQKPE